MTEQRVINFVTDVAKNGISQHTTDWLQAKKTTVGGSTLAAVIGCNPYESDWVKCILTRVGLEPFGGAKVKCSWGNLFEDIIKIYVERLYKTTVHGDNIFHLPADGPLSGRIGYSPDGLCVISNDLLRKKYLKRYHDISRLTAGAESTVLLEFKAPFNRRVDEDIPGYYLPQPLMGMDTLRDKDGRLCDMSLFIEAVFRVCDYSQIDDGRLHRNYPSSMPKSDDVGDVHCIGMMIIYGPAGHDIGNEVTEMFDEYNINNDLIELPVSVLNNIIVAMDGDDAPLRSIHTGPCKTKVSLKRRRKEIITSSSNSYVSLPSNIDGLVPYGSIFWKMMDFKAKPIFPVDGYILSHGDKITEFTDLCRAVRDMEYDAAENYLIEKIV